ncbi:bis-aminopropyl spermidine synthase family protein [Planomonospora sp. ID82291]|nr:bis-aminopropyl spermidine synthase family protein [Planomonospora sp. ID82291]
MEELLRRAGVDGRRLRTALALLGDGRWWTLAALVRETATSRRAIEALLRAVEAETGAGVGVEAGAGAGAGAGARAGVGALLERSGDRFRLREPLPGLSAAPHGPADPVAHLLGGHAELLATVEELVARAPRGRQALDHVAATADTVVRRALLMDARFWLPGARILCVGDHDLTSLATALLRPDAEVAAVDLDERILAYIAEQADRLGVTVRTRWADLRLGLPASVQGWADLAVTDPPYTPEGIGLFASRAVEGLADREHGRVLLAYGAGEHTPALALKVQHALSALNLVSEAIYPDFNRYHGAEAIGSAADLYVLRPTTKTWPAVAARVDGFGAAIYTHGPQSIESRPADVAATAAPGLPAEGLSPAVLVGEWPRDTLPKVPRARLATWLAKPYAADPAEVAVAVPAGMEAVLPRLLLATRARRVRAWTAAPAGDPAAGPLSHVYELTVTGRTVDAVRRPLPETAHGRVLRRILDNAHGKLANTWREALIRERGELTKRQAKAVVAEAAPWSADVTALELPAHRLAELPAAVAASLAAPAADGPRR